MKENQEYIEQLKTENSNLKAQINQLLKAGKQQKELEKELQKSDNKLKTIFSEISNIAIQGYDKNRNVIYWNKASENLYGYSRDEAINKKLEDLIIPDQMKDTVIGLIKNWHENDIPIPHGELVLISKDRKPVPVYSSHVMYKHTNGNKELFCVDLDISKIKNAEEESRKNLENYKSAYKSFRLMADTNPDMLWAKDMDGNFIFTNKAICDKLLNAKDVFEPIGKHVMFFVNRERNAHKEDKNWFTFGEECGDSDAITIEKKKTCRFDEYGNVFGKYLFLDVFKAPLLNDNGEMIGTVGSARDVTEQKRLEQNLKESENNLRALFNAMTDIVFEIDNNGKYLSIAPTVSKLLYKSPDELTGKTLHEIFPKQQADMFLHFINNCLHKNISNSIEYPLTIGGKTIWFEGRVSPKTKTSVLYIARDITRQKQAGDELAKHREHLEELVKERTAELEQKNAELERFNKLFVGREFRIKELRDKVKALEERLKTSE